MKPRAGRLWDTLRLAIRAWSRNKGFRMSAAVAFFAIFSLVPLLVIAVQALSSVLGEASAHGELSVSMQRWFGRGQARELLQLVRKLEASSLREGSSLWLGIVFAWTASRLFVELRSGLNTVWESSGGGGLQGLLWRRVLGFVAFLGAAVVLGASVVAGTLLPTFALSLPGSAARTAALIAGEAAASLALGTLLFALIYRILPAARIAWKDLWRSSFLTAALFAVGRFAIGAFLRDSRLATFYGATASIVVVLLWVYYSAIVFYFGAHLARADADLRGVRAPRKEAPAEGLRSGLRRAS